MIGELHIDGFRGLDGLAVAPLGRVNVIVGPGSSGKTNLLESAFLFCSTGDPGLIQTILGLRGITQFTLQDLRSHIEWCWTVGRTTPIVIKGNWNGVKRSVAIRRVDRTTVIPVTPEAGGLADDKERRDLMDSLAAYELETVVGTESHIGHLYVKTKEASLRSSSAPNLVGRFVLQSETGRSRPLAAVWTDAEDKGDAPAVTSLLRSLDSQIVGVRLRADEAGRAAVRIEYKRLGNMPLEFFGAGIGKALAVACYIAAAKDGLLIIDEFDASLHVGAQARIIRFVLESARRHNVQLMISTHSLETVDGFLDCYAESKDLWAGPEDLRILQLRRSNGNTEIRNLDCEEAQHLRDQIGYDLRFPG